MIKVLKFVPAIFAVCLAVAVAGSTSAEAQRRIPPPSAEAIRFSFAPVARKTAPAVVNVYARGRVQVPSSPFMDDPFFRRFFGGRGGPTEERMQNSLGSGVIVHPSGIVVTNTHVVKVGGNAEIKVVLADKREFDARVVTQDEKADIAVLQLEGGDGKFNYVEFEDSDSIEVGDLVLAIGNPFGVGQTVTQGIVSALARSEIGQSDVQVFIQTDAAINPGNSGGALVDMNGRLVGINTAIFSKSGGNHGIGFAIPANLVKLYVDSAISGRRVQRPWVGAKLDAVTREIAEALGLARAAGAVVVRVQKGGPAAEAGLQPGDIVTAVDGADIADARTFNYRITTRGIGNAARLSVLRRGQPVTVDLALQVAPEPGRDDIRNLSGKHPLDGARVANIGPRVIDELSLDDDHGVVVTWVRPGSIAANLNFGPGDVILSVRGAAVETVQQLDAALKGNPDRWQIEFKRDGRVRQLQIRG